MTLAIVIFVLLSGMGLSVRLRKLTFAGAVAGGIVGLLTYLGGHLTGLVLLTAFFILGTVATSWKKEKKKNLRAANDSSRRTAGQVLANGGMAALLGLLATFLPEHQALLQVGMAGALSSAAADTISSELGMVYGRRFYNVVSWKKELPGFDGVVSLEGTALGLLASCSIALIYALGAGLGISFVWIVLAGTAGNLCDSFLGATLERDHRLNNNAVNFLNTALAAVLAMALVLI